MFVSSSTGSVQESLYNHFKEAIPIKPSAKFLQKIAVSIAFYFIYYYAPQSWIWGWVRQLRSPSPPPFPHCDELRLFYITSILLKFVCVPLSVMSFLSGALPSLEEFWILLGTQHTRLSSATFITFFATQMPATQINPTFLDVMFIQGNHLSIFLLSLTLLIWGMVLHWRQCLMEHTVIICNFVWIPNCLVNPELQELYMIFQ